MESDALTITAVISGPVIAVLSGPAQTRERLTAALRRYDLPILNEREPRQAGGLCSVSTVYSGSEGMYSIDKSLALTGWSLTHREYVRRRRPLAA